MLKKPSGNFQQQVGSFSGPGIRLAVIFNFMLKTKANVKPVLELRNVYIHIIIHNIKMTQKQQKLDIREVSPTKEIFCPPNYLADKYID